MEPIVTLGAFSITPYSLMMLAGTLAGVLLAARVKEARPILPWAVLGSILFGHWFWCLFNMEETEEPLRMFFEFWRGGYTLYGAVAGGLLAAAIGAKALKTPLIRITDAMAPGAAAAIFFGRMGEYFSGAGFGSFVEKETARFFPLAYVTYQDEEYLEWSYAVWFWEALAALIILAILLGMLRQNRPGKLTAVFITLLGTSQILLEQFRRDNYVVTFNSFIRFSQVAAILSLLTVLILMMRRHSRQKACVWLSLLTVALASATVMCAEFSFDKPWFDTWMRIGLIATAVSAAVMLTRFRGAAGRLPGGLMILTAVLLGLIHFISDWNSDVTLLYAAIAFSVTAIGITMFENMGNDHPEKACL